MKKSYSNDKPTTENTKVVIVPHPPVAENPDSLTTKEAVKNLGTEGSEDKGKTEAKTEKPAST